MSRETMEWLRGGNLAIGFTGDDGPAWWAGENYMSDGTHFDGPVPVEVVERILSVQFAEAQHHAVHVEYLHADGCAEAGKLYADCQCPRSETTYVDKTRKDIITPDNGMTLGVFKMGWQLHGYKQWTADQISAILDTARGELGTKSVGLLRNRAVAFMQAQLTGSGLEVGGYPFTPYILAATSVDGSLSSTYATGVTAAVCDNTLDSALLTAVSKFKVKHSRNSAAKLGEVRDALGLVYQAGDDFSHAAAALQDVEVTGRDFTAWLDEVSPVPPADPRSSTGGAKHSNAVRFRATLTDMWTYDTKVAPWSGTAFGVLQLDNTFRTWKRNVAGADGGRLERNLLNMVTGVTAKEDARALDALAKVMGERLTGALA
jgi:phage/plasmid-like protein (TIGR03299 family)